MLPVNWRGDGQEFCLLSGNSKEGGMIDGKLRRVWIYTQDRPFTGEKIYAPVRNPEYNESNYRTTVSLPEWSPVKVKR
ncbi:MAG: hypothetical protein JWP63_2685 [Candidatus Solibacter sp.]|nr:hypothetical protein [Candidatus Solibacter sp.]